MISLDHMILRVRNQAESARFYQQILFPQEKAPATVASSAAHSDAPDGSAPPVEVSAPCDVSLIHQEAFAASVNPDRHRQTA
jgi:hypothetical protein